MALTNYSYTAAGPAASGLFTDTSPAPLRADLDDLLYSPENHQQETQPQISDHEPFAPPSNQRRSKLRKRNGPSYLPPPNQFTHYPRPDEVPQNPYQAHVYQPNTRLDVQIENQRVHEINPPQYDNTGQYVHDPSGDYDYEQRRLEQGRQAYRPGFGDPPYPPATQPPQTSRRYQGTYQNNYNYNVPQQHIPPPTPPPLPQRPPTQPPPPPPSPPATGGSHPGPSHNPPSYTKVEQGGSGGKTQLHAILDYDDDNYDEIPAPGKITYIFNIHKPTHGNES